MGPYVGESLEQTLARSRCHKGRLLYYFPQKFRYIQQANIYSIPKITCMENLLLVVLVTLFINMFYRITTLIRGTVVHDFYISTSESKIILVTSNMFL